MITAEELHDKQIALTTNGDGFILVNPAKPSYGMLLDHILPMEYTGLNDYLNREIFVGDILKSELKSDNFPVSEVSKDVFGAFILISKHNSGNMASLLTDRVKICGTIYTTPEKLNPQ